MRDFSTYLFRAHEVGNLMIGFQHGLTEKQTERLDYLYKNKERGRLTDKQTIEMGELIAKRDAKPELSKGAKSFLRRIHKQELFKRSKDSSNDHLEKGILQEEEAFDVLSRFLNKLLVKNKKRFENEFLTGEPDNIQGIVRELKCSWDYETFPIYDEDVTNTIYWWQLQSYMELCDMNMANLIYVLVNTPESIIDGLKHRTAIELGVFELPDELSNEIQRNCIYDDVSIDLRVKILAVQRDKEAMRNLEVVITMAREYLNELESNLNYHE